MKFGKSFEKALEDEDLPDEWKAAAIKYKSLKKCINKVVKELESLGLTTDTIKDLLDSSVDETGLAKSPSATIEYLFDGTTRSIHPEIRFTVDVNTPQVDELSTTTRSALKDLLFKAAASEKKPDSPDLKPYDPVANADLEDRLESMHFERASEAKSNAQITSRPANAEESAADNTNLQTIQIKLDSDVEFFDMLGDEVDKLDDLQSREKAVVLANIDKLGIQIANLVRPNNKGKVNPDLEAWRQILRLYEDAGIFRPSSEVQRKTHSPEKAAQQLSWFIDQVQKAQILPSTAKGVQSRQLYNTFYALNLAILQQIKFQSMNRQAMSKILKKFDKRTALTAKQTFPAFMAADPFFANGLAQAMYYALASNIMAVVPQLDDFECPVCTSITIKPVRLSCSHVFCVRCLIRLQVARENHCPICRRENVLEADSTNIDWALLNFLKMYFPREAKEKQKENEREARKGNPWLR